MTHLYSYIPKGYGVGAVIANIQGTRPWQTAVGRCPRVLYTWEMVFIHQSLSISFTLLIFDAQDTLIYRVLIVIPTDGSYSTRNHRMTLMNHW